MTVTRTQAGKTPKKTEHPGFVETPGAFRKPRKSGVSTVQRDDEDNNDSSTGVEDDTVPRISTRRRKSTRAVDEVEESKTNGHTNGFVTANGHANGHVKPVKLIDGWAEGIDSKIDKTGHFEFGGSLGVTALMIGFPLLMWYMWIGATFYDGKPPLPEHNETFTEFLRKMGRIVYNNAYPSLKAWAMYWGFLIFEGACYCLMPGVWTKGKPLPHENGRKLDYYCSAAWSWWTTIALAVTFHFTGIFKLYTIIDEFGPLMTVSIISGFAVAIIAYFSAIYRGKQHRMTGAPLYDFFMGAELNPRMFGILDFKMFFEVRLPWFVLFLLSLGVAARQYERYGYVSSEAGLLVLAFFLYGNACAKAEDLIVPTWDMYYEKWGFMLIFWNLAGVPFSYCHCLIFLANHDPKTLPWNNYVMTLWYFVYLFVYWVWDTTNSQKNYFRAKQSGGRQSRTTFPQLPWRTIENPKFIPTEDGNGILADGWYGYARKIHYTCDLFFALSWGGVTGFSSPFPWFYPVFFACMIAHRALRDIQRCRAKYGKAWEEYERQVPYLFIPYVF